MWQLVLEVDMPRHDSKVVPDNRSIRLKAAKYWIGDNRFDGTCESVWIEELKGEGEKGEYRRRYCNE